METADVIADVPVAVPEAVAEAKQAQRDFYRSSRPERVKLSAEEQKVFDRAFAKREAKLRREYVERQATLRRDVLELVWACEQLLFKKLTPQQVQELARGVSEIRRDYESVEATCQTAH